ncbi:GNAT family N-acetyltransferase [Neolewinella litorea]|uniref:GNAT family N-acetyltransferase n=1 Tax=Neolewinella litorea TaxID=2562452 RepID=A0A4S4NKK5_9BACT|nr:GNAT family N-acetyltransferase [Neolewinella litorea]THH40339.1 GNAT family N-acetyltransferase [Neolewinella litorea]
MSNALVQTLAAPAWRDGHSIAVPGFPDWAMRRYRGADDFAEWPAAGWGVDDFWLSPATLSFLSAHPQGERTEGIELRNRSSEQGVLLTVQTFRFGLAANVGEEAGSLPSRWNIRRRLLSACSAEVLCFGQMLTSGDHGQAWRGDWSGTSITDLLVAAAAVIGGGSRNYRAILFKDLTAGEAKAEAELIKRHFHRLPADPVMRLDLRPFNDLDDYLSRLSSKYRVRYRRARGKLGDLERRRLSAQEVVDQSGRLHELYRETSRGADFNVVDLSEAYFRWLGTAGEVHAYFNSSNRLVGFTTAIVNGNRYHAHYLGLEESYKHSHHLYHNMLYDLLRDALSVQSEWLDFGRTALEIKSSLGATTHRYDSWLRVRPAAVNALVPWFVPAVFEAKPWQARNPFRTE